MLLVAKRMHAVKTAIMTGTTTNGEVMLIGWLLGVSRIANSWFVIRGPWVVSPERKSIHDPRITLHDYFGPLFA